MDKLLNDIAWELWFSNERLQADRDEISKERFKLREEVVKLEIDYKNSEAMRLDAETELAACKDTLRRALVHLENVNIEERNADWLGVMIASQTLIIDY